MSKNKGRTKAPPNGRSTDSALQAFLLCGDDWGSLGVHGYSTLLDSPDVAAAVSAIATPISAATIHLMKNTNGGATRVKNELSKFMDIHPYSLGTRMSFLDWIVTTMLTSGDGNSFVLPMTRGGYLEDLVPMPGAYARGVENNSSYVSCWQGREFRPDEVLHFVLRPDHRLPWMGRGVRMQLKDVLKDLINVAMAILEGDWKAAWDGIVNIVKNIGSALYDAGKAIFTRLWDGIKNVWDGIKSWVDEKVSWLKDKLTFWDNGTSQMNEGGVSGFSHASGLAYVPYDNYPANLHRGEMVLNANDASGLLSDIRSALAESVNAFGTMRSSQPVVIQLTGMDSKVMAEWMLPDIRSIDKSNPEVVSDPV